MKAIFNNFKIKKGYIILLFLLPTLCLAQSQNESTQEQSELKTFQDNDLVWLPAPSFLPRCTFTVVHGDMSQPNLDVFFKVPENTKVPKHWHHSQERMILISGEMEVQYEGEPSQLMKTGSYAYGPAKKPHLAKCLDKGPCVLFIALVEPFDAFPITIKN
ncbi:cupin domain-containing protein [uncultured Algibacter sp.]|jgi:mannose-6-phosphate isomerase-like protein (cupin superfamily)|uniref:cupin domain-containing protein n=1 Tax=uncultured Algibacter sp. TaxID=298659 RepID=UPI0025F09E59|nr:cupin domain-containing protein [uncultured Algibacter sp.]